MSIIIITVVYLLPGIIASSRHHHNALAIWLVTLFLGWTGLGWLIAFIWSLTNSAPVAQPIIINNNVCLGDATLPKPAALPPASVPQPRLEDTPVVPSRTRKPNDPKWDFLTEK